MREVPFDFWQWEEQIRKLSIEDIALCKIIKKGTVAMFYLIYGYINYICSYDNCWSWISNGIGCLHHGNNHILLYVILCVKINVVVSNGKN